MGVSNEEDSAEEKRDEQVAKYLSCEQALDRLQHKVTEVFGELVTSQKELAQVTSEVETQLESLRTARAQLGVPKEELVSKEPVEEDTYRERAAGSRLTWNQEASKWNVH